jgi:hypothetical protein
VEGSDIGWRQGIRYITGVAGRGKAVLWCKRGDGYVISGGKKRESCPIVVRRGYFRGDTTLPLKPYD